MLMLGSQEQLVPGFLPSGTAIFARLKSAAKCIQERKMR